MALLQQIIELLSRPPGSTIYHILTLFALQVVLGLAITRRQRDLNDEAARRMTFAAAGILIARLILLVVGLAVAQDAVRARTLLPPLEQAIDLATVILLIWGLISFAPDRPRLADGVLLFSLVVVAVLFLFFQQVWRNQAVDISVAYNSTVQAYFWGILQMVLLLAGAVWLFVDRNSRWTLRPLIVTIVLLTHVAHFFNYPEVLPSGTDVAYWLRLGYLVAFPLWAVLAYRDGMRDLMTATEAEQAQAQQMAQNLQLSTGVINARIPQLRLEKALDMVTGLVETQFASIGMIDDKNPQTVVFTQSRPALTREASHGWKFNFTEHAAFRLAYEQQRGIELLPRGVGARQVHELSQQFTVGAFGPVFIEPLVDNNQCFGFLLLAAKPDVYNWSDHDRAIIPGLVNFLSKAFVNSRRIEGEVAEPAPSTAMSTTPRAAERDLDKERLIIELAETRRQLAAVETRARQAEAAAVLMQQRIPGQPTTARPQVAQASVNEIVESALSAIMAIVRAKNLKLDLSLKHDLPLVAVKEPVLKQLVISLLENAARVSTEGGRLFIEADLLLPNGSSKAANSVVIHFNDSGPGIQPEDTGFVFDTQYSIKGGRAILGLADKGTHPAIVQKLAQASGGDLTFKTEPAVGTTFSLVLPIAELRPISVLQPQPETSRPSSKKSETAADRPAPALADSSVTD